MAQYTVITKDITTIEGNNKLEAVLVYCYIKSRENYKTHLADNLTYEEISHHLNIPLPNIKRIVPTLYKNPLLFKGYEHIGKDGKTYLIYEFNDTYDNFFYIDNSLLKGYEAIPDKYENQVKGLLLLLKANCLNGTNNYLFKRRSKCGINKSELSNLIDLDVKTLDKYFTMALKGGLIKKIENGIAITDVNIFPFYYKTDYYSEYYTMLSRWCMQKSIVPPNKDDSMIDVLAAHYPTLSRDIILLARQNHIEPNVFLKKMVKEKNPLLNRFLPYQLYKRKVQPEYLSWDYLFKVLDLEITNEPQRLIITM